MKWEIIEYYVHYMHTILPIGNTYINKGNTVEPTDSLIQGIGTVSSYNG